jgi:hypothetical protein
MRIGARHLLLSLSLACLLASPGYGPAQGFHLNSKGDVKGLQLAIGQEPGVEPAAFCRVDKVFGDFQTRGFFRIGVLPLLVLDGLRIEIHDLDRLSPALIETREYFSKSISRKAIEGRNFTLSFAAEKSGRVRSHRVRLESRTAWELEQGSLERPGLPGLAFSRATLTVCGPQAGELLCETTNGPVRLHVRSLLPAGKPDLESGPEQARPQRSAQNPQHQKAQT